MLFANLPSAGLAHWARLAGRCTLALFLAIALTPPITQSARAAEPIVVTTLVDDTAAGNGCSLREAIINANTNSAAHADCTAGAGADLIRFSVGGTVTLGSPLPSISDALGLRIDGSGLVTISGSGTHRHFVVDSGASLALTFVTLAGGKASNGSSSAATGGPGQSGGSIVNNGELRLYSVRITGSSAGNGGNAFNGSAGDGGHGGAIATFGNAQGTSGVVEIWDSTLDNNAAGAGGVNAGSTTAGLGRGGNGGAIYSQNGSVDLYNVTLVGNKSGGAEALHRIGTGAAIYASGGGVGIWFSTITRNSSYVQASSIAAFNGAHVALTGSVIADGDGNSQACSAGLDASATFVDSGGNIESTKTCNLTRSNSRANTNPGLDGGGLRDNGGPVPTVALTQGSIAIDFIVTAATAPLCRFWLDHDARLNARPLPAGGACDAGAFEFGAMGGGGIGGGGPGDGPFVPEPLPDTSEQTPGVLPAAGAVSVMLVGAVAILLSVGGLAVALRLKRRW